MARILPGGARTAPPDPWNTQGVPFHPELALVSYQAAEDRYEHMKYRRCGRSGIQLPAVSLGLWQLARPQFEPGELAEIDRYAQEGAINIWAASSSA